MSGMLYIVATPIGNLKDITFRAIETLQSVDIILCEDTRVTKNLLDHYQIKKELLSYHHHSDARKVNEIKALLAEGKNIALVTDAGTPGISDPGNQLVSVILSAAKNLSDNRSDPSCHPDSVGTQDDKAKIIPIPGPCAVVAALSVSGFPTDRFTFLGFPPHKNKRQKYFTELAATPHTIVFYESGHRILKCLGELQAILDPKRQIVVCRELTKKFETIYRVQAGELGELKMDERGEFVIVIN